MLDDKNNNYAEEESKRRTDTQRHRTQARPHHHLPSNDVYLAKGVEHNLGPLEHLVHGMLIGMDSSSNLVVFSTVDLKLGCTLSIALVMIYLILVHCSGGGNLPGQYGLQHF